MATKCFFGTSEEAYVTNSADKDYIKGVYPSVATNSRGDVVCVHNSLVEDYIYYAVGKLENDTVKWVFKDYICTGAYPKVVINEDRQVVMMYNYSKSSSTIRYRTGTFIGSSITWQDEYDACGGRFPSLAMSGIKILVVFQASSNIHYSYGYIESNNATITWMQIDAALRINASYPSVAMNDRLAVVLYSDGYRNSNLLSVVGDIGDSILWGEAQDDTKYTQKMSKNTDSSMFHGDYPSVILLKDESNTVVSTLQRGMMAGRSLYARCGQVLCSEKKIKWHEKKPGNYVHGCYSSLAAVKGQAFVEMHCTNAFGWPGILFHVCKVGSTT